MMKYSVLHGGINAWLQAEYRACECRKSHRFLRIHYVIKLPIYHMVVQSIRHAQTRHTG